MTHQYSFKDCLQRAERISWRVEDLIGGDKRLDFGKAFMPETLARCEALDFLSPRERLKLNQIRGHTYLRMFGLIEEFILPFVLDHARPFVNGEDYRVRAFLEFAGEEAKHIHLFRAFAEDFARGFGTPCAIIGPAEAVAAQILSHHPLAVALAILQIEWMTQRHFLDSIHEDGTLDPQFKSLLKHHWMEEAQHAQLDTLMVMAIAEGLGREEVARAAEDYFDIGRFLDDGLKAQTALDLAALEAAIGRTLPEPERAAFLARQHQANRWTYLGSGMSHPRFLETLGAISPETRGHVERMGPDFS